MRRGRGKRGIIVVGMVLGLLMGCNNGGELEAQKRLGEIGRSAEGVFYSFIDFIADTLGFTAKAETTKQQVGEHFNKLGEKLGIASGELEKVAVKAAEDTEKEASSKNLIRVAVDAAKVTLNKLKEHLESLKDIGDSSKVGEVASNQNGVATNEEALKKVYDALKGIVDIAKKEGVKAPEKSTVAVSEAALGHANVKNGAKVLAAGAAAGGASGPEAATIVSAVSGEQILAAIVESTKEDSASKTIGGTANGTTSALKFAKGDSTATNLADDAVLAGAVAGGIALRSLVKDGKLASHSGNDKKGAEVAGRSATNKLLVAVEDIIKKTVKNVIGTAKQKIDEARAPKSEGQK